MVQEYYPTGVCLWATLPLDPFTFPSEHMATYGKTHLYLQLCSIQDAPVLTII